MVYFLPTNVVSQTSAWWPGGRVVGGAVLLVLVVTIGMGCRPDIQPPTPQSVDPSWAYSGDDQAITIIGEHFYPEIDFDVRPSSGSDGIDGVFDVFLVGPNESGEDEAYPLDGGKAVTYQEITAVVPSGMPEGTYDLNVVRPAGGSGWLNDAFSISDTRVDYVDLSADDFVHQVQQVATVDLAVLDPVGLPVEIAYPVVVTVTGPSGPIHVEYDATLAEQEPTGDGGIRGVLDANGTGVVAYTVDTPQTVTVRVEPEDPGGIDVSGDELAMVWTVGSELSVHFTLPDSPFVAVAGEPFTVELRVQDQWGNVVEDVEITVLISDACNTFVDAVVVSGVTPIEVVVERATSGSGCSDEYLESPADPFGTSESFTVLPGEVSAFSLLVSQENPTAGDEVTVFVSPVDAWGNVAAWSGKVLELTDSVGGMINAFCDTSAQPIACVGVPTVAGEVTVFVDDHAGVVGESEPIIVAPGPASELEVFDAPASVVAGATAAFSVEIRDVWGNVIDADGLAPEDFEFSNAMNDAQCTVVGTTPALGADVRCTFQVASATQMVNVRLTSADITTATPPIEVLNGSLVSAEVISSSAAVVAGEPFTLTVATFDAWNNPYIHHHSGSAVDVLDDTGTVTPGVLDLEADGTLAASVAVTASGDTTVAISQNGVELGRTDLISVAPAVEESLLVSLDEPWAWVGEGVTVSIEVVDEFENRTQWAGAVTVTSQSDAFAPIELLITNGIGVATVVWAEPASGDVLVANTSGELSGETGVIFIVESCAEGGPIADVLFGGFSEALVCFDEASGTSQVQASMASSVEGDGILVGYGLAVDGGPSVTGNSPDLELELSEAGTYEVQALAAAVDGCGHVVSAMVYVGPDNGEPVGPVELVVQDTVIDVPGGTTTIDVVGVMDCTRDYAVGGMLNIRTDRATLSGLVETGQGLAVTLGPTGDAAFHLDASSTLSGGVATMSAWVPSGAANGVETVFLDGDSLLPTVWGQDPVGAFFGDVDHVALTFSEPIRADSLAGAFSFFGPTPVAVHDVHQEGEGEIIIIELVDSVEASLGLFTLTCNGVRDLQGNPVDGAWTGAASAYVGAFGGEYLVDPVETCSAEPQVFTPDGDDGAGEDADFVFVEMSSSSTPAWWVFSVRDQAGVLIEREQAFPSGPIGAWVWDGRDVTGRIVDDGIYTIEMDADDGLGNRGGACSRTVTVQQRG